MKLVITVLFILGGAIGAITLLLNDVAENTEGLACHETAIDTLSKKHTILNQSFTSFRESVEEDLSDIEESLDDMAEEQSETHDAVIRIATKLGVD